MPTAAKLVAAVMFALLGVAGVQIYGPLLPEATPLVGLLPSVVPIGLLCGWLLMGRIAGRGYGPSMGNGISVAVALTFWMTLLWACVEMIERSTKMRYDGPMEAVLGALGLMVQYGALMLDQRFLGVVLIGGAVAGFATEWAARRWS